VGEPDSALRIQGRDRLLAVVHAAILSIAHSLASIPG
jgi:hypothetical protein